MQVSLCQVGIGLIVGSLVVCMYKGNTKKMFLSTLTLDQQQVFKSISRERFFIYTVSLALGGVLGYIAVKATPPESGDTARVCGGVGVAFITAYLTYQMWPKSHYMLQYLTAPQQTVAWLEYYKTMKNLYHTGFLVGLLGFGILSKGCIAGSHTES